MTLYELSEQYAYLYNLLSDGDIDEQVVSDSLEGVDWSAQFEEKADAYAKIIRQFQADAATAKAESDRLLERKKMFESRAAQLKERLQTSMIATDKPKFKTAFASYSISKNPARLVVDDVSKLQDNISFWKPRKWDESELDKTAVKEHITAHGEIPGAHIEQGESLKIK